MSAIGDKRDAGRLLAGLENGGMTAADAAVIAERLDPVLIYLIITYLRVAYPASDPVATSVLERVVKWTSTGTGVVRKAKAGEQDPISRWFEKEHVLRNFRHRGQEMIDIIVDKLES